MTMPAPHCPKTSPQYPIQEVPGWEMVCEIPAMRAHDDERKRNRTHEKGRPHKGRNIGSNPFVPVDFDPVQSEPRRDEIPAAGGAPVRQSIALLSVAPKVLGKARSACAQ